MELKIYNKKFNGRHSDSGDIQIPLEDVNDVIFSKSGKINVKMQLLNMII